MVVFSPTRIAVHFRYPERFTVAPLTVSPDTIPDNDTVHDAVVFPSYVLLLALILGVNDFAVIFAVVVALVLLKL